MSTSLAIGEPSQPTARQSPTRHDRKRRTSIPLSQDARTFTAALIGGAGLQLAAPPSGIPLLSLGALAPVLWCLQDEKRPTRWGLAGLLVGIVWFASFPRAAIEWGAVLAALSTVGCALMVAIGFCLAGLLRGRGLPVEIAFPLGWTGAAWAAESLFQLPVSMAASMALESVFGLPLTAGIARSVGIWGLEFWVASIPSLAVLLVRHSRSRPRLEIAALLAAACSLPFLLQGLRPTSTPADSESVWVHAVVPQITTRQYRDSRLSPKARRDVAAQVDNLIKEALGREPGIVATTEGATGIADLRIKWRRERLKSLLTGTQSDLLLGSKDLAPSGDWSNVAFLLGPGGAFRGTATKSHPMPIAESSVVAGSAQVLHSKEAKLGILVCFDALFTRTYQELSELGAELLIAVTDDASFGTGGTAKWHAAHAALRAQSVGLPLVFIANGGPLVTVASNGSIQLYPEEATPHITSTRIHLTRTNPGESAQWIAALFACLLVASSSRAWGTNSRPEPTNKAATNNTASAKALALALAAATLGPVIDAVASANASETSLKQLATETRLRLGASSELYVPPTFAQTRQGFCGFAALAFALHSLGDRVFEFDLIPAGPRKEAYSMSELAAAARRRGFRAWGEQARLSNLPRSLGEVPLLAHFRDGHFVTVFGREAGMVLGFDPAAGRLVHWQEDAFRHRWSGRVLRLATRKLNPSELR